jgi:di/tricarboxylate transporter
VKEQPIERRRRFRFLVFGLLALAVLALPLPAFSQNCALCYTQAASAGARMIEALKSGILILIIPPTLGSVGMIFVMRHKHHQTRRTNDVGEFSKDW